MKKSGHDYQRWLIHLMLIKYCFDIAMNNSNDSISNVKKSQREL